MPSEEPRKIICSTVGVGKVIPPDRRVLDDISLSYFYGAKIGVIGPNGAGKSTLLRILAGVETEYEGEVHYEKGVRVGFLPQEPPLDDEKTVGEVVEEGLGEAAEILREYERICERLGEDLAEDELERLIQRQSELQEKIEAAGAWDLESRVEQACQALRTPPSETKIGVISGGERRRVALARLLLSRPDVLLLDEPTNHLDAETVAWLEHHLAEYPGTVIAVTHDRYFLENVAEWILELDRGKGIPFRGNYSAWLAQKEARLANEEKAESKRRAALARELEWVRAAPKARQAKSKARLRAYEELAQTPSPEKLRSLAIYIPPGPRLGEDVIAFEAVAKAYDGNLLYENLTFRVPRGAIVGIVGPNGAGKTTLFRMLVGEEKPDAGTVHVGETVKLGYVDQSRDDLDGEKLVWEEISGGEDPIRLGKVALPARAYVAQFNFTGSDQQKPVRALSGGERNRVHLAKVLKSGANVLLLDEPTNDLDVDAIRALEEGLLNFAGTVLVVSHDRWFLDRVATHILAFEGDSSFVWFEGPYSEYEKDRRRRLGPEADVPKRIRYRKLTRA